MQVSKNNTQLPVVRVEPRTDNKDFHSLQQCYRYIIENAHEGIWMVDAIGVTTYVNERIAEMLGTTRENMKDKSTFDFFFTEDFEKAFQVSARCTQRVKEELDFRLKKMDESELWAHITLAPIQDKNGQFMGSIGMLTDITEQKKIEQALSESEEQYRIFFDQGLVGAVEVEPFTGKILAANRRICDMLGYTEQEMKKFTALDLTYVDDKKKHLEDYARLSSSEIPFYTTERRYVKRDSSVLWTNVTIGMVRNNEGKPLHSAAIIVDITDRKILQEKLLKDSEQRQKNLTRAVIKCQEKEREIIGRELHDSVNQVLAVVKLYNEASLTADEAGREEYILKSIKYLNECMTEIRKISKSLVVPNFDAIPFIEAVKELIASINATNKLRIILNNNMADVHVDEETQIAAYRVMQEHLSNIIKHSGATELTINLTGMDNNFTVEITDNGNGFDPKQKRKGIGITNMISRVEAVNGQIEFNTSKGKGCTLLVIFSGS